MSARVYNPVEELQMDASGGLPVWFAAYEVERNGVLDNHRAGGVDWLQALMMAIEGVRREIPEGEEDLWCDATGVPSWQIIPRRVPINDSYAFYRQVCDMIVARQTDNS